MVEVTWIFVHFKGECARYSALLFEMTARGVVHNTAVPPHYRIHRAQMSSRDETSVDLALTNNGTAIATAELREIREYVAAWHAYGAQVEVEAFKTETLAAEEGGHEDYNRESNVPQTATQDHDPTPGGK